jgi:hypothetical protein
VIASAYLEPDAKPDPAPEFYRPNEDDRLARAKDWIQMARGKSLRQIYEERRHRGLPPEPKE